MSKFVEPPYLAADLKELKLPMMLGAWQQSAEDAQKRRQSHADYLADLVSLEVTGRRERRIQRRIQDARFPS